MYAYAYRASLVKNAQIGDGLSPDNVFTLEKGDDDAEDEATRTARWARNDAKLAAAKEAGDYNPDFAYWRKFNKLHGWMEKLYSEKGGAETFNCEYVRLTEEDLDQLHEDSESLEPTGGFFFGSYEPITPEETEEVREFVKSAKAAMADGMAVVYSSWW